MSNKTQRDARVVMGCPAKTWPTLTGSGSSTLPPSAKKSNWKKRRTENTLCLFCGKLLTGQRQSGVFCGPKCWAELDYQQYIQKWKAGVVDGSKCPAGDILSNHIRRYIFEKYNSACVKCGWHEVNQYTGKVPCQVNHIDGNSSNHKEENLELLCPSCHSLTPSYGGRNRGNGRKTRYAQRTN